MREVQCDFMRHNRPYTKDLCPGEIHEDKMPLQQHNTLFSHKNKYKIELCTKTEI